MRKNMLGKKYPKKVNKATDELKMKERLQMYKK